MFAQTALGLIDTTYDVIGKFACQYRGAHTSSTKRIDNDWPIR